MRVRVVTVVAAGLLCAIAGLAPAAEVPFIQQARELARAHADTIGLAEIGASRQGRTIVALRLAAPDDIKPEDRPALVIVAGLDGRHLIGCETAVGVATKLVQDHAEALKKTTVYIIPCANPDNVAWQLDKAHPLTDFGRTFSPFDADHDARIDEDPAEDMDGDGAILSMRVKNPAPGSGLKAEYMTDPDNAKLLKKADATKGERAEFALLVEGRDRDGDGKYSEDGIGGTGGGGVDLNMNFPYRWPEFADGAGPYELSEPESLAIAKWMLATPNIAAVLSYGPGDTLVNVPDAGKFDATNEVPLGIENGDKPYWEEIAKQFKDATHQTGAPSTDNAGSFQGWAYAIYGVYSFSTPVWVRPDLVKKDEPKPDDKKDGDGKDDAKPDDAKPDVNALIEKIRAAAPEDRRALFSQLRNLSDEDRAKAREALGDLMPAGGGGGGRTGGGRPGGGGQPPASPATPAAGQPPAGGPPGGGGGGGRGGGGGGRRGGRGGGPPGAGGGGAGAATRKSGEPGADDAKWLKYADEIAAADKDRKPPFTDWHPFKHPQLGEVEIGGFVPGFKLNPPATEAERLVAEQTKFAVALMDRLPRVHTDDPVVEKLGPGLWRITVRIVNDGYLPSAAEIENKAKRGLPTLVTMGLPLERVISGEKHNRAWVIPGSGGRFESQWIVRADDGETVEVKVRPNIGPARSMKIELKEASR